MRAPGEVAAVIPARNQADRVAVTTTAALAIPGVDMVVVVDDGSTDDTGSMAREAGARSYDMPVGLFPPGPNAAGATGPWCTWRAPASNGRPDGYRASH